MNYLVSDSIFRENFIVYIDLAPKFVKNQGVIYVSFCCWFVLYWFATPISFVAVVRRQRNALHWTQLSILDLESNRESILRILVF
jgi:hypothetical protein